MMNNNQNSTKQKTNAVYNKPLNFCQVNINGLSKHSKTALDKFSFDQQLSIIALQETKLNSTQIKDLDASPNLETFMLSKEPETYGVGLLISPSLFPQRMKNLEENGLDIVWCLVKINQLDVLVASAYCPPHNSGDLRKIIKNIKAGNKYGMDNKIKNVLVFGDFNSRSMNWGDTSTNHRGKILLEFIDNSDFMLYTPADKTFVSPNNGGSVIDLLVGRGKITEQFQSNWTDRSTELFTGAPIRGHYPVLYSLTGSPAKRENKTYQDYKNTDWKLWQNTIESELEEISARNNSETSFLEELATTLNKAILKANEKIPKKIISRHSKPFWTNNLSICSKELEKIRATARRRATPNNIRTLQEKKAEFKSLLIKEKNDWIKGKLSDINVSDTTTFWNRYKSLFGENQVNYIGNLAKDGVLYTKDGDKEHILFDEFFSGKHLEKGNFDDIFKVEIQHYYQNIVNQDPMQNQEQLDSEIGNTLKELGIKRVRHGTPDHTTEDILNTEITSGELDDAITSQKTNGKSTDGYDVNPIMLKHLGPNAKSVIKNLFNLCLKTGIWCWNNADVCFLRKADKDSYLNPGSYRPICITSYIGKLLERVLERRLRDHCLFYNILDTPQEGFCPRKSTVRYLFKLMTNLNEAKRKKLVTMLLLIDFEKAFDSVWIPGLITKLYNYGIQGSILKLLNNFLASRSVSIKINGKYGKSRKCSLIGLPQGSVLSPLLFIIYISELLSDVHVLNGQMTNVESKAYKFADDGTVSVTAKSVESCHQALQHICNNLLDWCKKWRLKINCSRNKTEIIIINGNSQAIPSTLSNIKIGDKELQYVKKSKVLGVIIDAELSFIQHTNSVLRQCWHYWYKISKNTTRLQGLNIASLSLLFKTLVVTRLMYASPVWLNKQIDCFKDLWSRAMLKISGSEYHTERNITEIMLNIPPLDIQLDINTTKFLLKCMTSEDDMIATILQIEENSRHPYFTHIQNLRKYLLWKERSEMNHARRKSAREIELIEYMQHENCHYSKENIKQYMNHRWHQKVEHRFPDYNLKKWDNLNFKELFPRHSTRAENTHVSEFIHGHSLRFANFKKSIGIQGSDICQNCNNMADSPEHQLFECTAFHCPERDQLLEILGNNIADFNWNITSHTSEKHDASEVQLFLKIVEFIVANTKEHEEHDEAENDG